MSFHVLTSSETRLRTGWTAESHVAVVASGGIDASAPPGDGAKLTVVSLFSSTTVRVPPGAQIELKGWNILGSRKLRGAPGGEGPHIDIRAITVLGSIRVKTR